METDHETPTQVPPSNEPDSSIEYTCQIQPPAARPKPQRPILIRQKPPDLLIRFRDLKKGKH